LAQIQKLDQFLDIQRRNHAALKEIMLQVPEISFRRVPDPEGDSCTFISWFLPTEAITRAVITSLKEQGILAGNFYWFDNNWHYIRKWDHLKQGTTLHALSEEHKAAVTYHASKDFSASHAVMSRCISTAIGLLWTEEQIKEKGDKIVNTVKQVLAQQTVST
jgi:8-amino-3,8-dideoxy-alpha-D-manno-octulosonate transaminase